MTVDEANHANTVGSSWRRVVSLLEQDHRVSPRQRGFVILEHDPAAGVHDIADAFERGSVEATGDQLRRRDGHDE